MNLTGHPSFHKLELIKQEAVAVENQVETGKQNVHVVVKNQPFNIVLSSVNKMFNFNQAQVKAKLYYDQNPPKAVDFIQQEPLQYVNTVNSNGAEVSVETKISILSSQHQGSLFIVLMNVTDSASNETYAIMSFPIRIVSKIDHIKKEGGEPIKKKSFNEVLHERLHSMSRSQELQAKMTEFLLRFAQGEVSAIPPLDIINGEDTDENENDENENENNVRVDFQTGFNNLVGAFRDIADEATRTTRVRAVLSSLSSDDLDQVSQLVESLASLSCKPQPPATLETNPPECICVNCSARKEFENMNMSMMGLPVFPAYIPITHTFDSSAMQTSTNNSSTSTSNPTLESFPSSSLPSTPPSSEPSKKKANISDSTKTSPKSNLPNNIRSNNNLSLSSPENSKNNVATSTSSTSMSASLDNFPTQYAQMMRRPLEFMPLMQGGQFNPFITKMDGVQNTGFPFSMPFIFDPSQLQAYTHNQGNPPFIMPQFDQATFQQAFQHQQQQLQTPSTQSTLLPNE